MGRLSKPTLLVWFATAALCSCDYVSGINHEANRTYHESRWHAVVESCVSGDTYSTPLEPTAPRVCAGVIESSYRHVAFDFNNEQRVWKMVVSQAQDNLAFSTEMLEVLDSRDTTSIEQLAPQIAIYFKKSAEEKDMWQGFLGDTVLTIRGLKAAWKDAWPDNDLQFDLLENIAGLRRKVVPVVSGVRREALEHYYQNEFSRLAMQYLENEPEFGVVSTRSNTPQGCESLAEAHQALETALLVRYSLDKAIGQDIALVSRLAKVDLSSQSWDDIKMPTGRYGEKRVSAAIARLKLLKYLDTLVTDSLGIIIRDVGLEWDTAWPGHTLETNIFEYAGVPKVTSQ